MIINRIIPVAPLAAIAILLLSSVATAQSLHSPNGQIRIDFAVQSHQGKPAVPCYSVHLKDKTLLTTSTLGLNLAPAGALGPVEISEVKTTTSDTTYDVPFGKSSTARDHYNELTVSLKETSDTARKLDIVFRAYDDGAAFRYHVPKQNGLDAFTVMDEDTQFAVAENPNAFILNVGKFRSRFPYEADYIQTKIDQTTTGLLIGLPLLLEYPDSTTLAITEAHLHDYAAMYLNPEKDSSGLLRSRLTPMLGESAKIGTSSTKVKSTLPHDTPWRVMIIGENPGALIESNLVYNLNPPNAIGDTSWIKPGKTAFPWWNGYALGEDAGFEPGLNTATMKYYIDFCAEAGLEYHSLDGLGKTAWYGGPINPYEGADITTTTLADLDLMGIIQYAKEKGVGIRFWMNWQAARKWGDKAFPLYEKWGIEGVMLDFINGDDQQTINDVENLIALAAKHHLTVTLHNVSKPTGLSRTYPNLLSYEAVKNLEWNKWHHGVTPEHDLIVPFARMLAGPLDYHAGGFRYTSPEDFKYQNEAPLIISTRARELARYVVYEGYLPMAADYPAAYRGQDGLDTLVQIPTTWDETHVINGKVGDYITIARRSGDTWYVATMSDEQPRTLNIPLTFLGKGDYTAQMLSDNKEPGAKRENLTKSDSKVTAADTLKADMISAGGNLIIIQPKS